MATSPACSIMVPRAERRRGVGAKRVDTAKRLSDRLLCRKARQSIGDVEPGSLEVHEDVTLRPESGIIVECPGRDADHAPVYRRQRSTAYPAECPSIPWRFHAYWCLVGLDELCPGDPLELRGIENQLGKEGRTASLPAARAMTEIKGGRGARHLVP